MEPIKYTPIPYAKAARLLDGKEVTIRTAANEGRLTKVPSTSKQLVIKEQVMLFQGKKQIRETMLSESEHAEWLKYKNAVEAQREEIKPVSVDPKPATNKNPTALFALPETAAMKLVEAMISGEMPPNALEYARGLL